MPKTRSPWPASGRRRSGGNIGWTRTATCGWSPAPGTRHPDRDTVRPLLFLAVPDSKSVKNRIHLDLRPDDQAVDLERLEMLGATPVSVGQSGLEGWVVLADPEGNEFCVLSDT
jgi:hypothetical protein